MLLWRSLTGLDKVTGALTLAFGAFGIGAWQQLLPWWSPFAAFGVILFYGFLRENYEGYSRVEGERDKLRNGRTTSDRRVALKDALGTASERGQQLHASDPSVEDAERWVNDTAGLIEAALGKGEVHLFVSGVGITLLSGNNSRQQLWIEGRLHRLSQLITRVDTLYLRPDFDPLDWINRK